MFGLASGGECARGQPGSAKEHSGILIYPAQAGRKGMLMCQKCGCSPCEVCGEEIEDGVCCGCGLEPVECICAIGQEYGEETEL